MVKKERKGQLMGALPAARTLNYQGTRKLHQYPENLCCNHLFFTQIDFQSNHNLHTQLITLYLTQTRPSQPLISSLVETHARTHTLSLTHTHSPQTPQTIQLFKKSFEECLNGFESIISSDPKLALPSLLFNDISQLGNHNCSHC